MARAKWKHGWIPENAAARKLKFPEIHKSDLSTGDARRSRAVSSEEFQRVAARGAVKYKARSAASSPHSLKGQKLNDLIDRTYPEAMKDWGGTTTDSHTGRDLPSDADAYALTSRPPGMDSVSIPEGSSKNEYAAAIKNATTRFGDILGRKGHALGVFHDNDKHTIDIDPVLITSSVKDAEDIGAYTRAVGGAYHFKSGDGYWPPHVVKGVDLSVERVQLVDFAVLARRSRLARMSP